MISPLTAPEKADLDKLTDLLGGAFGDARPALVRAELDGREVAVVVAVLPSDEDRDDYILDPLAILVDDDLLARITPPA